MKKSYFYNSNLKEISQQEYFNITFSPELEYKKEVRLDIDNKPISQHTVYDNDKAIAYAIYELTQKEYKRILKLEELKK